MSKTLIIVIAAVAMLFMGMMGAGFFILWSKVSAVVPQGPTEEEIAKQEEEEIAKLGPIYPLETLIVNLADAGGKRYLRTTMQLELDTPEVVQEIENKLPQVKNSILMVLPTKRYSDINTTEGKIALRDELITTLNGFFTKGQVTNIYFTEFVIQ